MGMEKHSKEERLEAALALANASRAARALSRDLTAPTALVQRAQANLRTAEACFARVTGRAL
jgi:hypothetical protein